MEGIGLVLLTVVALASMVQASLLVAMALGARQLAQRVDLLRGQVDQDLRPALEDVRRISRNLAEVSELASAQARRVDGMMNEAALRVDEARENVRRALLYPAGPLREIVALLRAFRRGVVVYRTLGSVEAEAQAQTRRYKDDEHLFI